MNSTPSSTLLAAIERNRKRLWGLCYRMTGSRHDADDLSQEAIARSIEREDTLANHERLDGWLVRIATTVCLDHQRHQKIVRRVTDLADPLDDPELLPGVAPGPSPEAATIMKDDVRFAVIVALQRLSGRQRAALILHDVCDYPLSEIADSLGTNANAAKALVNRARTALARSRHRIDVDPVADRGVVDRLVRAIALRSVDAVTELLDEEVWGIVDGGGVVQAAKKPTFGIRAVSRQWANANRRLAVPLRASIRRLNGEPAVVVALEGVAGAFVASIHVETRAGRIAALRIVRDPTKLQHLSAEKPTCH
ncbi:MAG: sigma-70 family RNA polymerase sigma factor [Deltaproteobacteria bacterium]|nr:sigma-70 family RNA polymerase sigma factor [Deltaproteobacteria bacterium]MBI3389247.1 sigma-70 family RNA polymerase sigma factor [Deltaproteobacteria bacterium]